MNSFTGLDVKKIHVIVSKRENGVFNFENPKRAWDGFILITKGGGFGVDSIGKIYPLEVGSLILLRRGDKYEINMQENCSYITSAYELTFDNKGVFPVELPFVVKCSPKQFGKICDICDIWHSYSLESYTRCRIMILEMYLDLIKNQIEDSNIDREISLIKEFVHENFKRNFSGAELARYCSMSISYLRGKFLKHSGVTITQYRDNLRLLAAKEMLVSECYSVSEIARELGYCDIYHFSKTFKRFTGVSPSSFIKHQSSLK